MRQRDDDQETLVLGGATFLIRVQYRQNASWQGTIQWLDQKASLPFRSTLEMMMLIQEALDKAEVSGADSPMVSWQDKRAPAKITGNPPLRRLPAGGDR